MASPTMVKAAAGKARTKHDMRDRRCHLGEHSIRKSDMGTFYVSIQVSAISRSVEIPDRDRFAYRI